jgi:hypothetical protein
MLQIVVEKLAMPIAMAYERLSQNTARISITASAETAAYAIHS